MLHPEEKADMCDSGVNDNMSLKISQDVSKKWANLELRPKWVRFGFWLKSFK